MPADYIYQPSVLPDYDRALDLFCRRHPRARAGWVDPTQHLDETHRAMREAGISLSLLDVDAKSYQHFYNAAGYESRYPQYYAGNLPEKSFEHFVCLQLLKPTPSDVFVDVAAEHSPLAEIAHRLTGCRAYSQDISYPAGIEGDHIGGDACNMPVPHEFATSAALTCSLEHFEGDGDTRLFWELARILRPGGRVVVVPLYIYREPAIVTDPSYTAELDIPFDPEADIFCYPMKNRQARIYSAGTLMARIIRPLGRLFRFTVLRAGWSDPKVYCRWILLAERL